MKYETHIPAAPSATSHFNPYQMERILDELVASRSSGFRKVRNALRLQLKQLQPRTLRGPTERLGLEIPDHHSLNISDHHDHFSSVVILLTPRSRILQKEKHSTRQEPARKVDLKALRVWPINGVTRASAQENVAMSCDGM